MRLTVLYPTDQEPAAQNLRIALGRIANLDCSWIATSADCYLEDLAEAAEEIAPLIVVMSASLIDGKKAPRVAFRPLLEKIERGESSRVGLITLDHLQLPKLLEKIRTTTIPHADRIATNWALNWLGHDHKIAEPLAPELSPLVDQETLLEIHEGSADHFVHQLRPYFEAIEVLEVHQQAEALLQAQLQRIQPQGRILYVVEGHPSPLPPRPEHASILHLPHVTPTPIANPMAHAAKLIPLIPNVEAQPLPFSTYHFEQLLPVLFAQNWQLAERLARRTGTFFRLNHRVGEAIWLYETLEHAASSQCHTACAEFAAEELAWLRTGGESKHKLLHATQGSLFF